MNAPGSPAELTGLNLDQARTRIATGIAGIRMDAQIPLDKQLEQSAQREKLKKESALLEKQAWVERQPKRKMELAARIKGIKSRTGGNEE